MREKMGNRNMNQNMLASFQALREVYSEQAFSNLAVNRAVEEHRGCDGSFVRAMTRGVLRNSILADYYIDRLASKGIKGMKSRTKILLRMGIFAVEEMDSMPEYAAVNETVALARSVSKGTAGFINAVLRSYLRERKNLFLEDWHHPDFDETVDDVDRLSIALSYNREMVDLFVRQYGEDEAVRIMEGMNAKKPLVLRSNGTKTDREDLMAALEKEDCTVEALPGTDTGVVVREGSPVGDGLFSSGHYSVQGAGSLTAIEHLIRNFRESRALPPDEDAFSRKPRILDMCAAPGGKTAAMAELTGDRCSILACDVYDHRLELIEKNANRLGLKSISTCLSDGSEHRDEWESAFDLVLADVPCSGLGTIGGKPEIKLRGDVAGFSQLTEIQRKILANAVSYVKPGGMLMYSTCTLNRDENEGVTEGYLSDADASENGVDGLECVEKCLLLPYNITTGFYWCILRKSAQRQ